MSPTRRRVARLVLSALALSVLATVLPSGAADVQSTLERGRERLAWFIDGRHDALYDAFSATMRSAFPLDQITAFRQQIEDQAGAERKLIDERVEVQDGLDVYIRRVQFEKQEAPLDVIFAFNGDGQIEGFLITSSPSPHPSPHLDYEPATRFRLPFDGEWTVFWGGRSVEDNYHAVNRDQRFAADLVIARNGIRHEGDGTRNEDYFCFDVPILAPAAGTVVAAVDQVADNVPGVMNADEPFGNHVVIDHGEDEYSVLAHFRSGSVAVAPGDSVDVGTVLGRCGNSGNSSEPHLHIHVQNGPDLYDADGLPLAFCDFVVDDMPTTCSEPVRGQRVRLAESQP